MNDDFLNALHRIFAPTLPRLGPGDDLSTRRALTALFGSPLARPDLRALDIGCGNGTQTLRLVAELGCHVTAVDNYEPYLAELERRAAAQGVSHLVTTRCADMATLDLPGQKFDLVWAEGSAFIIGLDQALTEWGKFLPSGGALGLSDLVWLRDDAPDECRRFFGEEYPAIPDLPAVRNLFDEHGWDLIDDFPLPESSWWASFYEPLARRLDEVEPQLDGNEMATTVAAGLRREIEMYRKYSRYYGYEFFVARKRG